MKKKENNDQFDCSEDAILHATIKPIHLSNAHNSENLTHGVNILSTSSFFAHLVLFILIDHIVLVVFFPQKQFILISSAAIRSKVLLKRIVIMS